jgi:nucleoside-diphosphate-sugar epimerase/SAM-dependent methyltransferase
MTAGPTVPRWTSAYRYSRAGLSPLQSFVKHSLVPLAQLVPRLPSRGTILDLGCGEGILANLVARSLPECRVVGVDRDPARLELARRNAPSNAEFRCLDVLGLPDDLVADAAILNDVVHHHAFARHWDLLAAALGHVRPGGVFILKEVDRADRADHVMTGFFDRRLYPDDPLSFRSTPDWLAVLRRLGLQDVETIRLRHPWPASRTLFCARRTPSGAIPVPEDLAAAIGAGNRAVANDTVIVFMTGVTGFIGGHLARRLLRDGLGGRKVRLLALVRDPDRVPADALAAGLVPVYGDLTDVPRLRAALDGVNVVFHLAAEVKLTGGTDLWRNNHQGTLDLLEALKGRTIERFVLASTMGAVDRAPHDSCTAPLDEDVAPHPLSEYGRTKLAAERAVMGSGLPYTIVRIAWSYGSGMTPDTHVRFLLQGVADGKAFSWFAFPGRVSTIAVPDVVDALLLVARRDAALGQVYYASDDRPVALGALFRRGANVIGRRAGSIEIPRTLSALARTLRARLPLAVQNLNSDVLCVSSRKLMALGFSPRVSPRQGLALLAEDLGLRSLGGRQLISLVTGAASGIGRAVAERLRDEGHALLLVDRDAESLTQLAARLQADCLVLDLTHTDSAERLAAHLETRRYRLDWVVNAAGIGVRGDVAALPAGSQEEVIELNCRALTSISRLALQHYAAEGLGTLVNVASSAGFQPLPFMAVYAATKAYVHSFTRAAAGEVAGVPGILVMTVSPAGTATDFQRRAGVKHLAGEVLLAPSDVAERIVRAAYAGKRDVIIGRSAHVMRLVSGALPSRWQVPLWTRLMRTLR